MAPRVARVHYEIDDELHRQCKAAAALADMTLKDFVTESLQRNVDHHRVEREAKEAER